MTFLSRSSLGPLFLALVSVHVLLAGAIAGGEDGYEFGGDQTWAFTYPADALRPGAALDLRYLNEQVAGEKGFVTASPTGEFRDGSGKPLRFWAINAKTDFEQPQDVELSARFLAKMGVNLARLFVDLSPKDPNSRLDQPDEKEIDRVWRVEAACKKQGIYVIICPFWKMKPRAGDGIDGYQGNEESWGIQFINPRLRAAYSAWVTRLYGATNPYTSMRLADDPAVAVIETQNEDSLLFWTFQGIKKPQKQLLARQFTIWLTAKYGSPGAALRTWGGEHLPGDDVEGGTVGLLSTWQVNQAAPGIAGRAADQVEFMARTQREYYQAAHAVYRALGCKQLVNSGNWQTADAIRLGDLERWTYTADEVIAVNKYFGGKHDGAENGWRIDPGHTFTSQSGVRDWRALPTCLKQVVGRPMMITESSWVSPNRYQTEGPFLMAAYQSLTGIGCFFWFAQSAPQYDEENAIGMPWLHVQGQHPAFKWSCSTPALMGAFPANALAFRRGDIAKGTVVVHESRSLASMFKREYPMIAEAPEFDPNRREGGEAQTQAERNHLPGGVDPQAFLVGPVEVEYGNNQGKTVVKDLSRYLDQAKKTITSNTGEITMDYGRGVCLVDAPRSKGVCGFLKDAGGTFRLTGATIVSDNRYAAVNLVAMDDAPLATSRKVLIQFGSICRPTGWATTPAGDGSERIVSVGHKPWQVVKASVTVTLANPWLKSAVTLDNAGFAAGKPLTISLTKGALTLTLPREALYVMLTP